MYDWEKLEERVKAMTIEDAPKRTPLSGATKKEEDVVGNTLISQCKQTQDKNFSILEKDFTRLMESAKLLDKFPLFFSQSSAGIIMSIPVNKETEDTLDQVLRSIMIQKRLVILHEFSKTIKDDRAFMKASREFNAVASSLMSLNDENKHLLERIRHQLNYIEDDLTMCNLFEGQLNDPTKAGDKEWH